MAREPKWIGWLWLPVLFVVAVACVLTVPLVALWELWRERLCFRCRHEKAVHAGRCGYERVGAGGGAWVKGQANYNADFRCACPRYLGR
jgi:hypothetical protein